MKQALHILRKDIRCLRIEICLLLGLAVVFAWAATRLRQSGWSESLYQLAAVYTIARLIHAEAIPGDRQFWLTRPYRRASLAAAKLIFIFVFVCLPLGGPQICVLVREGFPLLPAIPGLLYSQALIFFTEALPVAALAALTSTLIPFILAAILLAFTAFATPSAAVYWFPYLRTVPPSVEWIRDFLFEISCIAVSLCVILWQYRDRATRFSRSFGVVALYTLGALFLLTPASLPLWLQQWLSRDPARAAPVSVSVAARPGITRITNGPRTVMRIPLSITAMGHPADTELRADAVSLEFEWLGGEKWRPQRSSGLNRHGSGTSATDFDVVVDMEPETFRLRRNLPVTIHGSIYLTLFGDGESRVISMADGFTNVQDGLQCGKSEFIKIDALVCRSFFRWPARLVYARAQTESDFAITLVSYSPLPADTGINSLQSRWGDPVHDGHVTILTKKPLAHFQRDFRLEGIRLAALENRPPGAR